MVLAVRPEAVSVQADPASALRVIMTELAGADLFLTVRGQDGTEVVARADPRATRLTDGDGVRLRFDPAGLHLFDAVTGALASPGTAGEG